MSAILRASLQSFARRAAQVQRPLQRRGAAGTEIAAALQESYQAHVAAGQLEQDKAQAAVVGHLGQALHRLFSSTSSASSSEGSPSRDSWVWPVRASSASTSAVAEEHRRAAEFTARLAAENARKVREQQLARKGLSEAKAAAQAKKEVAPELKKEGPPSPVEEAAKAPQTPAAAEMPRPPKRSVYLYGPVGTGKTMLLDLFFEQAKKAGFRVRRQHFYEFMLGLHSHIHAITEERPVEVAANTLADELDVLCFDEFQITDIQDAVILPRLFEVLFLRGVVVVMTSNTAPQLLYAGGLNRHVHLPAFVSLLADHCTVLGLGASGKRVDYRQRAEDQELRSQAAGDDDFFAGADAAERLSRRWDELRGSSEVAERTLQLPMGRTLLLRQAAGDVCLVSFPELCGSDSGEADFYALAESFRTVLLGGVPRFDSLEAMDIVRRFVKLLDVLYDRRVRLVVAAAAPIDELFAGIRDEVSKGDMGDLAWRTALYSADGKAGMAPSAVGTVCEAVRATERAESRLREMRTRRYRGGT